MRKTDSRLRQFRRSAKVGASAAEVAAATGLAASTITRIELGDKTPRYDTALKILAWCAETAKAKRIPLSDRVTQQDLLPPGDRV